MASILSLWHSKIRVSFSGGSMETLCRQAHPSTTYEATVSICEPKEWWKSGRFVFFLASTADYVLTWHQSFCNSFSYFYPPYFQGTKIFQSFMWYLNPRQVFDLSQGGPKEGWVPVRGLLNQFPPLLEVLAASRSRILQ